MACMKTGDHDSDSYLRKAFRAFMKSRGSNPNKWAGKAAIPVNSLRKLLKGESKTITLDTAIKLADAEGVTLDAMIGREPLPPASSGEIDLKRLESVMVKLERHLLRINRQMTPDLKAYTVMTLYNMERKRSQPLPDDEFENVIKLALYR
jgi:hypothetical protein